MTIIEWKFQDEMFPDQRERRNFSVIEMKDRILFHSEEYNKGTLRFSSIPT